MDGSNFFIALMSVLFINIVLSGDNAVVIALACRTLPDKQKRKAIFFGSLGAIVLRLLLSLIAVWLLQIPFVQAVSGLLLLWIAVKLLDDDHDRSVSEAANLFEAVKTIIIADIVMSLDNVVAVVGAAHGHWLVVVIGIITSVPLIIWGSQIIMRLMKRFPVIILLGAGLLGWTGGEMLLSDHSLLSLMGGEIPRWADWLVKLVLAVAVVMVGRLLARRNEARRTSNRRDNIREE